jgi:hypothetical protein
MLGPATRGAAWITAQAPLAIHRLENLASYLKPVTREKFVPREFNPDVTRCRTA